MAEIQPLTLAIFILITVATLVISIIAARRVRTAGHYYVAGGGVRWFVNGFAIAGDYLSAASFLGITGLVAFYGYDGFIYAIGFLAGWIVALFLVAEPLRAIGKYTFADALTSKFKSRRIRLAAAISTLVVSVFYLIPQMVGAGSIVGPLLGLDYEVGVIVIGLVVIGIVATAGMVSTTWVQFIKGFLLLIAVIALTVGVLAYVGLGPFAFIGDVINSMLTLPSGKIVSGEQFMSPGMKYTNPLDFVSLALALILGTAALPHILIRYYTVPKPADARRSTVVAIIVMGVFYMLILFLGLGAIYIFQEPGGASVLNPRDANMTAPLLAQYIGGDVFYAIISSIAFATILGTVSGLIMASAGAIAHDIYTEVLMKKSTEKRSLLISKGTAIGVGVVAIILGILSKGQNVAFLVGLAFAIAASANLPALLCTLFWKRTTEKGIVAGISVGLASAILLIIISPTMMGADAIFSLNNPGIVSIPVGFAVTMGVSLLEERTSSNSKPEQAPT
jgi:cation/acetate symporter